MLCEALGYPGGPCEGASCVCGVRSEGCLAGEETGEVQAGWAGQSRQPMLQEQHREYC